MKDSSELRVELGARSYTIKLGTDLIPNAGPILAPLIHSSHAVVVTDENVSKFWLDPFYTSLISEGIRVNSVILPPGEETKTFSSLQKLLDKLFDLTISRKTVLIALGGGVIGDITGFAAAVALRGIDYVQVPTTLLSQVDSSVGGKTGINNKHGKNLIGAFHQPLYVISDMNTLDTLPPRELLAGYAEIIKHAIIRDSSFFDWLLCNGNSIISGNKQFQREAVLKSCTIKAQIVKTDELEKSERMLLNMGHTFGHAFEVASGYSGNLLHGEAVAIGIVIAIDLSVRMGLCSKNDLNKVRNHFREIGLPIGLKEIAAGNWSAEGLIKNMLQDKKAEAGNLAFILSGGIGNSLVSREVSHKDLMEILTCYLNV